MTGKEIIERELIRVTSLPYRTVAPAYLSPDAAYAYVLGLRAAYNHALEMWDAN